MAYKEGYTFSKPSQIVTEIVFTENLDVFLGKSYKKLSMQKSSVFISVI